MKTVRVPLLCIVFLVTGIALACRAREPVSSPVQPEQHADKHAADDAATAQGALGESNNPQAPPDFRDQVHEEVKGFAGDELYTKANSLVYNGYRIIKREGEGMDPEVNHPIPVNYTVVKKHGKVMAKFDGYHWALGNSNDFGLLPVLGGKARQLVMTQSGPFYGRHWIVDLSSQVRVIFDSHDYHLGREWFSLGDIDSDGVCEVFVADPSYYLLAEGCAMVHGPLPIAIFKYDKRAKKYLPASHLFPNYYLSDIDDRIKRLRPESEPQRGNYAGPRLSIVVDYLFAGKEEEGWAFFDREYRLDDKSEVKSELEARLKDDLFYQRLQRMARSKAK